MVLNPLPQLISRPGYQNHSQDDRLSEKPFLTSWEFQTPPVAESLDSHSLCLEVFVSALQIRQR